MKKFIKNYFWVFVAIAILFFDRFTKVLVVAHLPIEKPIALLPFLNLYFTYNSGAAFSFLRSAGGWQEMLFICIACFATIFLIIWLLKIPKDHAWLKLALALILGGTIGNLIDRLTIYQVIDFIDFYYKLKHFPTFNIADSAITIGAIMLVIDISHISHKRRH
jgi:signal peptidase II